MALGGSSILQNLTSSVTGNVNKAYVLFTELKENEQGSYETQATAADAKTAKNQLSSLASALSSAVNEAGNRSGFSSIFGTDSELARQSNEKNYIPIQVQYNPTSITFSGTGAGYKLEESVGGNGNKAYTSYESPSRIIMRVDLIFDDTNHLDAFMVDGSLISASSAAQEAAKRAGQAVKEGKASAFLHKTYSVQNISELFVAAMPDAYSRYVGFVWNKMVFWGELTNVDVEFTMFNRSGNPIRSKVSLSIEQEAQGELIMLDVWQKAFKELVKNK